MTQSLFCERAFEFAARILKLCDRLSSRGPAARYLASQLMRSALSIGANAEEAQEAQTKPDFIAKMSISSKETREARWWLRLLVKAEIVKPHEVRWEQDEVLQMCKMVRSAILTARSSSTRGETRG
ncbi:MAG: four helix bundle protein [Vicinamibacterales bacterium]|nr:four helix bundle protein [Vicinamibacterales bacterium]